MGDEGRTAKKAEEGREIAEIDRKEKEERKDREEELLGTIDRQKEMFLFVFDARGGIGGDKMKAEFDQILPEGAIKRNKIEKRGKMKEEK